MEPLPCNQWIGRCRENKCCRKAFHEAHYYCKDVIHWKNGTEAPVCSSACANAFKVLFDDPIGKNMRCCECGKYSDVDQDNFNALKILADCKRNRQNLEYFCNLPQLYNCSRGQPTPRRRFEGMKLLQNY